jgi:hypothetical protein
MYHPQATLVQSVTGVNYQTVSHCQVVQQADDKRSENRDDGDQCDADAFKPQTATGYRPGLWKRRRVFTLSVQLLGMHHFLIV